MICSLEELNRETYRVEVFFKFELTASQNCWSEMSFAVNLELTPFG